VLELQELKAVFGGHLLIEYRGFGEFCGKDFVFRLGDGYNVLCEQRKEAHRYYLEASEAPVGCEGV